MVLKIGDELLLLSPLGKINWDGIRFRLRLMGLEFPFKPKFRLDCRIASRFLLCKSQYPARC